MEESEEKTPELKLAENKVPFQHEEMKGKETETREESEGENGEKESASHRRNVHEKGTKVKVSRAVNIAGRT